MKRKLIVTADDFGITHGVNEAIVRAYRRGIVTTTSLMVSSPAFESAIALARQHPDLNVGLHLNLTQGRSTCDPAVIPSLANSQGFTYDDPFKLAIAIARGRVGANDLEREVRAQLEAALGTGLRLTHIDGHKHVHVISQVLRVVCRLAPAYGIKAVRSVHEKAPGLTQLLLRNAAASGQVFKQYLFGKAASALWKLAWPPRCQPRLIVPECFYGIMQTGFLDFDALASVIRSLPYGVNELMCHPGYADNALDRTATRLRLQRERELELLTAPEVRDLIDEHHVELIGYKDLVEAYENCDGGPVFHRYSAL
jgi:hopanoid biosynthesis associated protein HpnK